MRPRTAVAAAAFVLFSTWLDVCSGTNIQCDADLTTKFAIEKRNLEKQLDCRMDVENVAKCSNISAVDEAWHRFEQINDEYSEAIAECKQLQQAKRRRTTGCACENADDDRLPREAQSHKWRMRRGCGCSQHGHRHGDPQHHKTSVPSDKNRQSKSKSMKPKNDDVDKSNDEDENEDDDWFERRVRRHRQQNAAELQKHEHTHHGRAHVGARHHRKHGTPGNPHKSKAQRKRGGHRRRHDHGSNDDRTDPEQVPDANDRSKPLVRVRRGRSCILTGATESDRLQNKYASLCDRKTICDKENLQGERKEAMKQLMKRRQRIYRDYLSVFDQCYGSVMHP